MGPSVKYCEVLGGPTSAIFGTITLDPLYFEVHIFLGPPDPSYMCLKIPKCAIFSTFWVSGQKNHPKVGVHREQFNIGNLAHIFRHASVSSTYPCL